MGAFKLLREIENGKCKSNDGLMYISKPNKNNVCSLKKV